jgi:iron complex transport system substrate-binding protein
MRLRATRYGPAAASPFAVFLGCGLVAAATVDAASGVERKAPRIVSLAPHLTEIAYAAGAGGTLVGTVEYSDFPEAARLLPRVGDGWKVDVERVLALRPDFVLAWESGTPLPTIERLEALGLDVVSVATFRLADVPAALRLVGRMAGTQSQAESAATRFEAEIRRLTAAHAGASTVTVFVEIDDEPLFTVNGRHVISEVVELCGGRNVFASLPQIAPQVSLEAVLARDPQVIVSTDDTVADPGALWRRWPQLTVVRSGTIYTIPSDTVARSTPRLVEGVAAVCAKLADARRRLVTSAPLQ